MLRHYGIIALGCWLLAFGQDLRAKSQEQDKAIWDEYGLEDIKHDGSTTIYRLKDPTGAFAAFQWQRPVDSRLSKVAPLAAETPNQLLVAHGNYLVRFDGDKPDATRLKSFLDRLPKVDNGPLPLLSGYLPESDLIPNSERYVLGPESLAKFAPGIPPSVAAFHLGAEAEIARFRSKGGEQSLVIFSYPTPQLARQRVVEFGKLAGVVAKREGPLVAVVLSRDNPDQADRLLAHVKYQAAITWDEYVPTRRDNIGVLVINCITLAGVLLAFCAVAGLAFGGLRAISHRWLGLADTPDPIITLGLRDR
jgi:hypothetical protein